MTKKGYTIGQVIYVISNHENRVVPLQIIEEVVRKTIEGEEVTYTVRSGEEAVQPLPKNAEVFETIGLVRDAMQKRASAAIDAMLATAVKSAEELYGHKEVMSLKRPNQPVKKQQEKLETFVELPDGTTAKVNLPDGFQ